MPRHATEITCPLSQRCLPRARRASALWTNPHDPAVSPSPRDTHAPRAAVLSAHPRLYCVGSRCGQVAPMLQAAQKQKPPPHPQA